MDSSFHLHHSLLLLLSPIFLDGPFRLLPDHHSYYSLFPFKFLLFSHIKSYSQTLSLDSDLCVGMKRVAVNPKTTSQAHPAVVDDQAKLQLRHQTLLQDHLHLQKEVVTKKKKLQAAKQKRDILLAEIRFLRRRQRHFLKLKSVETEPQVVQHETSNTKLKKFSRKRNNDASEAVPSKHSQVVVKEEGEQLVWEPFRVEKKSKTRFINDKRLGKRKIDVQDEVALNV